MSGSAQVLPALAADCTASGLVVLGTIHADESDGPGFGSLALIANAGPAMWQAFSRSPEFSLPRHQLDQWSRRVLGAIAARHQAQALFPFDGPPYYPFQRWALRTGIVGTSPIGVLVHPTYGPWFAFRGALAFESRLAIPAGSPADPCGACADKPCIQACPVGAIGLQMEYDVDNCRKHVSHRNNECFDAGCQARHACPLGRDYAYAPAQARFHMASFAR